MRDLVRDEFGLALRVPDAPDPRKAAGCGSAARDQNYALAAARQHGDDHQSRAVRVLRLQDHLVGDVRVIEVAGVNTIHANRNGLNQTNSRRFRQVRRSLFWKSLWLKPVVAPALPCLRRGFFQMTAEPVTHGREQFVLKISVAP